MTLFPTEQWLRTYRRRLNESAAFARRSAGWGVDFDGRILVALTDIPTAETTVGDLPPEALDGIPTQLRTEIEPLSLEALHRLTNVTPADDVSTELLSTLPASLRGRIEGPSSEALVDFVDDQLQPPIPDKQDDLLRQLDEGVSDGTIHVRIDVLDGACTAASVLTEPDQYDSGFVFRGPLTAWHHLLDGTHPLRLAATGAITVEGSPFRLLQFVRMLFCLCRIAATTETTRLFDGG